jgi:predicted AlkP superfamily pyrophosphatase or phosphodiesterase
MILKRLENQISKINSEGWVIPQYKNFSFSNIPLAIRSLLEGTTTPHPLSGILDQAEINGKNSKKVVLFLLDGFGYLQWLKYAQHYEFLERVTKNGVVAPITTVFPSTTAASLTTIHSGLTPQEHGLPEWWVYFEEINKLVATLPFSAMGEEGPDSLLRSGVDPSLLFDGTTLYQTLKQSHISSYTFIRNSYAKSVYSNLVHRGSVTVPYINASDLFANLRKKLFETTSKNLFYVYWDSIDSISHRYGPHSEPYLAELNSFTYLLQNEFLEKIPKGAAQEVSIMVTADHGELNVDPEETIYLNAFPEIVSNFRCGPTGEKILPWGSPRDIYLAIQEKEIPNTVRILSERLQGKARIKLSLDAVKEGLFGKGVQHKQFKSRVGDILILPLENHTIWYEHIPGKKFGFYGAHGGLTPDEMLVPFAVANLSKLL